jgi:Fe2+ or Zn2+ uptake regulation protein
MKPGGDMPDNQEQFNSILNRNKLKITTQRIAILNVLSSRSGEFYCG